MRVSGLLRWVEVPIHAIRRGSRTLAAVSIRCVAFAALKPGSALSAAVVHRAHVRERQAAGVNRRFLPVQLRGNALAAQRTEGSQRFYAGLKFLCRAELCWILFDIWRNQGIGMVDERIPVDSLQKFSKQRMILCRICLIRENPRLHWPVGEHRVNIIVHRRRRVITLERAEREVVVPRNHRKLPVILIEIVIVNH